MVKMLENTSDMLEFNNQTIADMLLPNTIQLLLVARYQSVFTSLLYIFFCRTSLWTRTKYNRKYLISKYHGYFDSHQLIENESI
jgi:hypothetical protein